MKHLVSLPSHIITLMSKCTKFHFSLFLLSISVVSAFAQMPAPVLNPDECPAGYTVLPNQNVNLSATDKVCLNSNYTSSLSGVNGSEVFVSTSGSFNGNMSTFSGTFNNYSNEFNLGTTNYQGNGGQIYNYGKLSSGTIGTINGSLDIYNHEGDSIIWEGTNPLDDIYFYNEGYLIFTQEIQLNREAEVNNQGYIIFERGTGNLDGVFENYGRVYSDGKLKYQNGNVFINKCGTEVTGNLEINAGVDSTGNAVEIRNDGVVIFGGILRFTGDWTNTVDESFVAGGTWSGDGRFLGSGVYWFEGYQNPNGTFGDNFSDFTMNLTNYPTSKVNPSVTVDPNAYKATSEDFPSTCSNIVAPRNIDPTLANFSLTICEGEAIAGLDTLLELALDSNSSDTLRFSIATNGTLGTATIPNAFTGVLNYAPEANAFGTDEITILVEDGNGGTDTGVLTITILPVNDAPNANNDTRTTPEETAITVDVLANDNDNTDASVSITPSSLTIVTAPTNGTASVVANEIVYTPNENFNGVETIFYRICDTGVANTCDDGSDLCDEATLTITVSGSNDEPEANRDVFNFIEDQSGTFTKAQVLTNDIDVDNTNAQLTVTIPGSTLHGTVSVSGNTYTYTPSPNFHGRDSVLYTLSDLDGAEDDAYIVFVVDPVNDRPTTQPYTTTVAEEEVITFTRTSQDDNDMLYAPFGGIDISTYSIVTPNSKFSITGTSAGTNGQGIVEFTFDPGANFSGTETITYKVCDNGYPDTLCAVNNITITVDEVNDPPVGNSDNLSSFDEDGTLSFPTSIITANDVDVESPSSSLTISIPSSTLYGTVSGNNSSGWVYTPNPNFHGLDSVRYTVSDGSSTNTNDAYIVFTVDPINDAPLTDDYLNTISEGETLNFTLTSNDDKDMVSVLYGLSTAVDGGIDISTYSITSPTTTPRLTITSTDNLAGGKGSVSFSYNPGPDFNGRDIYTYEVCDLGYTGTRCTEGTITINVTSVNDTPSVSNPETLTICEDNSGTITWDVEDVETNTSDLSLSVLYSEKAKSFGTGLSGNTLTYVPLDNVYGEDSVVVEFCDASDACITSYAIVTITPINDPFQFDDLYTETISENGTTTIDVLTLVNDTDIDYISYEGTIPAESDIFNVDSIEILYHSGSDSASASFTNFTFNYDAQTFVGIDTIIYKICDNGYGLDECGGTEPSSVCDTGLIIIQITDEAPETETYQVPDGVVFEDSTWIFNILNDSLSLVGDPQGLTSLDTITLEFNIGTATIFDFDVSDPSNLIATFEYNAPLDYNGPDFLIYRVVDNAGYVSRDTIYFNVGAVNDTLFANNDGVKITNEDTPRNIIVLSNDNDIRDNEYGNGIPLDYTGSYNPDSLKVVSTQYGTTTVNASTYTLDYTPATNFFGLDTIIYSVCDLGEGLGGILCDTAWVVVDVRSVNDTFNITSDTVNDLFEDSFAVIDILANDNDDSDSIAGDIDAGLDTSSIRVVYQGSKFDSVKVTNGVAVVNPETGTITYTPTADYNGNDTVYYEVCDFGGICLTDTIFITINPVSDTLLIDTPSVINLPEDTPITFDAVSLTNANDSRDIVDVLGNSVGSPSAGINTDTITIVTEPNFGTVVNIDTDITYTPNDNYNGLDSVEVRICDLGLPETSCMNTWFIFSVTGTNDSIVTGSDFLTDVWEDSSATINVLSNDNDTTDPTGGIDSTSLVVVEGPDYGTADVGTGGNITYTPIPNYFGNDTLIYEVSDNGGLTVQDTLFITVNPRNDAPIASSDTRTTNEDTPITIQIADLLSNDSDINDLEIPNSIGGGLITLQGGGLDPSSFDIVILPNNGTVSEVINGEFTYTPNLNFNGRDEFTYIIRDIGYGISPFDELMVDSAIVTINVTAQNDEPLVVDDYITMFEDSILFSFDPLANDTDPENEIFPPAILIDTLPSDIIQSITYNADNTWKITPIPNAFGEDTVQYWARDESGGRTRGTIYITVIPLNDQPVANNDTISIFEDGFVEEIAFMDNAFKSPDQDTIDGIYGGIDRMSFVMIKDVSNGVSIIDTVNGTVSYTPNRDFNGRDTIIYSVCDIGGHPEPYDTVLCDTAYIFFNVTPVRDLPWAFNPNDDIMDPIVGDYDEDEMRVDTFYFETFENVELDTCIGMFDPDGTRVSKDLDYDNAIEAPTPILGEGTFSQMSRDDGCFTFEPQDDFIGLDSIAIVLIDFITDEEVPVLIYIDVKPVDIVPPTGFSPDNKDGINDTWDLEYIEQFPENTVQVYNRWGNLVFEIDNYDNEENVWDGRSNVGGTLGSDLPEGTYFFIIKVEIHDQEKLYKGYVLKK